MNKANKNWEFQEIVANQNPPPVTLPRYMPDRRASGVVDLAPNQS